MKCLLRMHLRCGVVSASLRSCSTVATGPPQPGASHEGEIAEGSVLDSVPFFRQHGYLLQTGGVVTEDLRRRLLMACGTAVRHRGSRVVPASDEPTRHRVEMRSKLSAPPTSGGGSAAAAASPQEEGFKKEEETEPVEGSSTAVEWKAGTPVEKKVVTMKLRYRNKKEMDKAYESLVKERADYETYKPIPNNVSVNASMKEGKAALHTYREEDAKKAFEDYRDSGKLERDVRKGHHIDDAMRYVDNTPQTWCRVFRDVEAVRNCVIGSSSLSSDATSAAAESVTTDPSSLPATLSSVLGETIGELSGSLVVRLYDDVIGRFPLLANALPIHFPAVFQSFRDPRALTVLVPLVGSLSFVVYPGSHRVFQRLTVNGTDTTAFRQSSLWDIGEGVRSIVGELPCGPVTITVEAGSVLYLHSSLLRGLVPCRNSSSLLDPFPTMEEVAHNADRCFSDLAPSPSLTDVPTPIVYMMQTAPDGAQFDGQRLTWMSKDSHGPLYHKKSGDALRDDAEFPVLFNGLDKL